MATKSENYSISNPAPSPEKKLNILSDSELEKNSVRAQLRQKAAESREYFQKMYPGVKVV